MEIEHFSHEHPLTLGKEEHQWKNFTYRCSICNFDIDVICATLMERKIDHDSHKHPLFRQRKLGLFRCSACDREHQGIFYQCLTCLQFFIHEECFSLPTTFKNSEYDDHPLVLTYSLPSEYVTFRNYCEICTSGINLRYWVYYCAVCRVFAQVDCATSQLEPFRCSLLPRRTSKVKTEQEQVEDSGIDVIRFPVVDQSVILISHILKEMSVTKNETANQVLNHFSHDHPLILDVQGSDNESCPGSKLCLMNDTRVDETICNACVKPIFATPLYRCANQCNFFLHTCCVELPMEIQHPYHPEHPIILLSKSPNFFNLFECKGCHLYSNGFSYNCSICNFNLDVQCGSLPATIKHDRDPNHILSLKGNISKRCKACYKGWSKPILAYACNHCDFVIDSCCALLSKEVMHRYDEHPFILTYSPVKDHSVDYYCELCEKELNPKWWFYHCAHCDRSIHIKCLRPFYRWANIKYGRTLYIEGHHQHPLALSPVIEEDAKINNSLRVIIRGTDCDECGDRFYTSSGYFSSRDSFGFRCVHCNFKLCYDCAKLMETGGKLKKGDGGRKIGLGLLSRSSRDINKKRIIPSHEHRLVLKEEEHKHGIGDDDGGDIQTFRRCNGCLDPISSSLLGGAYYSCLVRVMGAIVPGDCSIAKLAIQNTKASSINV
ncbi:hypothetical protein LguiB_004282 [Lonicera macranthoides]